MCILVFMPKKTSISFQRLKPYQKQSSNLSKNKVFPCVRPIKGLGLAFYARGPCTHLVKKRAGLCVHRATNQTDLRFLYLLIRNPLGVKRFLQSSITLMEALNDTKFAQYIRTILKQKVQITMRLLSQLPRQS